MNGESTGRRHIVDARWWLLTLVFLFLCLEWWNIFGWNLRAASIFLYQTPESFTCPDQPRKAASDFFNFKVWLVVALAQAVVWGVVASVALRWLPFMVVHARNRRSVEAEDHGSDPSAGDTVWRQPMVFPPVPHTLAGLGVGML